MPAELHKCQNNINLCIRRKNIIDLYAARLNITEMLTSSGIFDQKIVFKTIGFINYTFKRNVWPTEHDKFSLDPVEITNETAITNRHNYENSLLMLCVTEDRFGISKDNFFGKKLTLV